jgi:hypothetical protein
MIYLSCKTEREEMKMSVDYKYEEKIAKVVEVGITKPKVGDILYSSWGYDQTNIEFFKVVKVSEFSVWIQEVGSKVVEVTGWAHEKVVPTDSSEYQVRNWDNVPDVFGNVNTYITKTHPIQRKKIQTYGGGYGVSLNSFSSAWVWDGKPKEASHTH